MSTNATPPYSQSAFNYPPEPPAAPPAESRSSGKRTALLVIGAVIVGALLFGGGFWAGSAVNSLPGMSDHRFGDGRRQGPGDPRDDGRLPGPGGDNGTDGSTDPSLFTL